tara:strand:- start:270 stop:479 length:210 start_codon:yes stop_codon:yes gene_type:complete
MESIMSLSQKILESTEVIETDDVEEKSVEERENIINNLKDRIKRLEVDMAHMLKRDFEYADRKRNEPIH